MGNWFISNRLCGFHGNRDAAPRLNLAGIVLNFNESG